MGLSQLQDWLLPTITIWIFSEMCPRPSYPALLSNQSQNIYESTRWQIMSVTMTSLYPLLKLFALADWQAHAK